MPISVLLSPAMFIMGTRKLCEGENEIGWVIIGVGILMMLVGVVECNLRKG